MAKKIIKAQMKQRLDTKANWAAQNPVLLAGELGLVSDDPNLYKVGDGVTAWNALPFRGFDGTLVHTTGNSETSVMSQKAVTDEFAKRSEDASISDDTTLNQYVAEIYAPTISSKDVNTISTLRIAYPTGGEYYNFIRLEGKDNSNIILLQESYATKEEALKAWSGVHWREGNAFLLRGNPTDALNYTKTGVTFYKDFDVSATTIISQIAYLSLSQIEENASLLQDQLNGLFPTINLFTGEFDTGYWLSSGLASVSGYYVTKPIYIKGGVSYKYPSNSASYGSNFPNYAFYDKNGNYIKVKKATTVGDFVILTEAEDCYVSVNIGDRVALRDTFMFAEEDQYPETYQPYRPTLRAGLYVPETAVLLPNPLRGKILAVNGDSICAGAGYAGGYAKIIAERNEMVLQNIAVGGGTITSGIIASDGTPRHSVCDTIANIREDADYILLEGGVNDAGLELPVGKIEDSFYATFDTSTYCGAFEQMCKELTARFAGKKYGYIAVHQMVKGYRVTNTDKSASYYWLAKSICEKWGVPFLDLNTQVPPFNYLDNTDIKIVNTTYTKDGDGWHPNEAGYKKYYCDKIEAFMLSL